MESIQYHLPIEICQNGDDAIQKGYVYRRPEYQPINITKVVVIRDGTTEGNPSVEFLLMDEKGQKYVVGLTGALIKMIPCAPNS